MSESNVIDHRINSGYDAGFFTDIVLSAFNKKTPQEVTGFNIDAFFDTAKLAAPMICNA